MISSLVDSRKRDPMRTNQAEWALTGTPSPGSVITMVELVGIFLLMLVKLIDVPFLSGDYVEKLGVGRGEYHSP